MKKHKLNFPVYIAIFLLVFLLYVGVIGLYEGMMKSSSNYGVILSPLIISLANLMQFPSNIFIKPISSDLLFFLGIFINLNFFTILIYIIARKILKRIRLK
jgi:hypothetical protein